MTDNKVCVAVVGAGLVGSLEACFLAQRGMEVGFLFDPIYHERARNVIKYKLELQNLMKI